MNPNKDRAEMLKQKQQGGPLPTVKIQPQKPTTLKGKMSNFFYHYKIHLFFIVVVLIIVGIFIKDIVTRVDYDQSILVISGRYLEDEELKDLEDYFTRIVADVTGNEKVEVSVSSIYLAQDMGKNVEMEMASQIKIVTELSAGSSYLYIFDEYNYQRNFYDTGILEQVNEDDRLSLETMEISNYLPEGEQYFLGLRVEGGSNLKSKNDLARYKEAGRLLEEFKKK